MWLKTMVNGLLIGVNQLAWLFEGFVGVSIS